MSVGETTQASDTVEGAQALEVEQSDQGLAAGFNRVRGEQPPTEEPAREVEPIDTQEQIDQEALRQAIAKVPDLEQFRGHTAEELRKVHGKFGELQRSIQQLSQSSTVNSEARKAAVEKLKGEYPELAELITPLVGGVDMSAVKQIVDESVSKVAQEANVRIEQIQAQMRLTKKHPDWEDVRTTPEYTAWLGQLPQDERQKFLNTWDSDLVSTKLTHFKTWRDQANSKKQDHQQRLARSVQPAGVPARGQTRLPDSAGLAAGFNRIRRAA